MLIDIAEVVAVAITTSPSGFAYMGGGDKMSQIDEKCLLIFQTI